MVAPDRNHEIKKKNLNSIVTFLLFVSTNQIFFLLKNSFFYPSDSDTRGGRTNGHTLATLLFIQAYTHKYTHIHIFPQQRK